LKLSNGFTKTDRSTFTAEDIADAGWIEVSDPPEVVYPNKLEWNGALKEWYTRPPNDSEVAFKWQEIRNECERLLASTDYKVIKAIESGVPMDPIVVAYRQDLRDLYNDVNVIDPWTVVYPTLVYLDDEDYNQSSDGITHNDSTESN
jgi:hypothetical protein